MVELAFVLFWSTLPALLAHVQGSVHDAKSGETLTRVKVTLINESDIWARPTAQRETDQSGAFAIDGLAPGHYRLRASTVGYGLLETQVALIAKEEPVRLDLALNPEGLGHRDTVEVHADPFDLTPETGPTAFTLSGTESKNLSSVLAGDPLRALQSAPGVTANDDFDSRFSLHGAPYEHLGLYLDGILLHQPFHTVQGLGPSGSTSVFNGDMVASMTVESEGYGTQFEDRTGGVIDIQSREGSTDRIHVRVNASLPDAGFLAEGPVGSESKGSWMVSANKSYLQYFLKDLAQDEPSLAFGFTDMQAQLTYRLTPADAFTLKLIDGTSTLSGNSSPTADSYFALNTARTALYRYTLANLGWQFTPNHSFFLNVRAAFTRERFFDTNYSAGTLAKGYYGEWVAKSDATWSWNNDAQFQFGGEVRPIHADGINNYFVDPTSIVPTNWYGGSAIYAGGFAQQSFKRLAKRLSLSVGTRWDTLSSNHQSALSPQASLAFTPWEKGRLSFAWGDYSQFPEISYLYSEVGSPRLLPARSEHYVAAFEERLGEQTRFRVDAFERNDRNLLYQPWLNARLVDGVIVGDSFQSPFSNTLSGITRGADVFLQRRTANGWTGWVSYTFMRSEMHDALTDISFPSDQDQRHTVNAYASYRLRPTLNLSSKFSWGSGFPVPGFFSQQGDEYFLAPERNLVRLPPYQRLDIRMNKSKVLEHAKMTFFVEVVNVLNHSNYRFESYNGFDYSTGQAYISLSKMFPIFPSVGVTVEF